MAFGRLEKGHAVFRAARFAVATGVGFLVYEAAVIVGVATLYHSIQVPSFASSSLTILELDVVALAIGNTVAFELNERVTVKGLVGGGRKGPLGWSVRWGKYQLSSLVGSVIIVVVQLSLLATISLSPVFGNIVGAIVSFPVTYAISMHFVWRVRPF